MKKILILSLILVAQLLAQPDFVIEREIIQSGKYFNSELHYFPANQRYKVYYSYKISYSQLFFEKNDAVFNAGFDVKIEIKDSAGNIIERAFDEKNIAVKDFEVTNSKDTFLQGLIEFTLDEGNYSIFTLISDRLSKRERRIPPIELTIDKSNSILPLIVFEPEKIICDNLDVFVLTNNSSSVPFNKPTNDIVIPVLDPGISSLNINVRRGDTLFISGEKLTESFLINPEIKFCGDQIVIAKSIDSTLVKIFLMRDFSSRLTEGPIQLEIYPDDSSKLKQIFNLNVIWIGKPYSLLEPEKAINYIEIIESKEAVSNILSENRSDEENLYNYWQLQDPTPETKYNELMNEFYSRVDYCEINFKTLSGNGGAKSDRGRTYIRFGSPDSIERDTDNNDKVVETWVYGRIKKKFVFVDLDGTGKFSLANGQ